MKQTIPLILLLIVTYTSSRPILPPKTCVQCVKCNGGQKVNIELVYCDDRQARQTRQTFLGDNNTPVIKYNADNEVTGTVFDSLIHDLQVF